MGPPRAGDRLGPYELIRRIDGGGNGDVWEAPADVAVKILRNRNPDSEPWRRFAREATTQRRLTEEGFNGILPVLAFSIPERGQSGRAWLAMPVASVARDAFGPNPDLESVIRALLTVAEALARLHERAIAHRDVKPQNIYRLDQRWLIGDFGLIQVADAGTFNDSPTGPGSLHYIAPELVRDPDANGAPADVYSLAKTIWVLATGQRYPPPGELRVDVEGLRLSRYSNHPRASLLDVLLEAATTYEADHRPSMKAVASDLAAWVSGTPDVVAHGTDNLEGIAREIASKVAPDERLKVRERGHIQAMTDAARRMLDLVSDLPSQFQKYGVPVGDGFTVSDEPFARLICPEAEIVHYPWVVTGAAVARARREPRGRESILETMVAALRVRDRDELLLAAGYFMPGISGGPLIIWRRSARVIIGSASQESEIVSLTNELREHLSDAVRAFRDDLFGRHDG